MKHIKLYEEFINEYSKFVVGEIYNHPKHGKFEVIELARDSKTKVKYLEGSSKGDIGYIAGYGDEGYLKESEEFINEDALTMILLLQAAAVGGQFYMLANKYDFHPIDDLKRWWADHKRDTAVNSILAKLKNDSEVIDFLNLPANQQEGKWKKLIEPKLSAEELKYLNSVSRDRVKAGKITQ